MLSKEQSCCPANLSISKYVRKGGQERREERGERREERGERGEGRGERGEGEGRGERMRG